MIAAITGVASGLLARSGTSAHVLDTHTADATLT